MVLVNRTDEYKHSFKPDAARYTEEELQKMAAYQPPTQPQGPRQGGNPQAAGRFAGMQRLNTLIKELITSRSNIQRYYNSQKRLTKRKKMRTN